MRKVVIGFAVMTSCLAFGQNVKFKKGVLKLDNKAWAKYVGCGMFDTDCSILKDKGEVAMISHTVIDLTIRDKLNPKGEFTWREVKFLGTNLSYEVVGTNKSIARILYSYNVFNEDGSFNMEKVTRLIEKYGQPFSRKYLNNSTQTVIIQDTRQDTQY